MRLFFCVRTNCQRTIQPLLPPSGGAQTKSGALWRLTWVHATALSVGYGGRRGERDATGGRGGKIGR